MLSHSSPVWYQIRLRISPNKITKVPTNIARNAYVICVICKVLILGILLRYIFRSDGNSQTDTFASALHSCQKFKSEVRISRHEGFMPSHVVELLAEVDHLYILSRNECQTELPLDLTLKATCILGGVLDLCAPKRFLRGRYEHALRVTVMHAAVLEISKQAGHSNIAVLEDDVRYLSRVYSPSLTTGFRKLLSSDAWSLIRIGYRPFFLQHSGTTHCPRPCRCVIRSQYSEHLCYIARGGCDLRSSDLYILNSKHFQRLQDRLLDLSVPNTKRIVDVHPLQDLHNQWLIVPQMSYQNTSDIPFDYQVGLGALYLTKCAGPRPLPSTLTKTVLVF